MLALPALGPSVQAGMRTVKKGFATTLVTTSALSSCVHALRHKTRSVECESNFCMITLATYTHITQYAIVQGTSNKLYTQCTMTGKATAAAVAHSRVRCKQEHRQTADKDIRRLAEQQAGPCLPTDTGWHRVHAQPPKGCPTASPTAPQ